MVNNVLIIGILYNQWEFIGSEHNWRYDSIYFWHFFKGIRGYPHNIWPNICTFYVPPLILEFHWTTNYCIPAIEKVSTDGADDIGFTSLDHFPLQKHRSSKSEWLLRNASMRTPHRSDWHLHCSMTMLLVHQSSMTDSMLDCQCERLQSTWSVQVQSKQSAFSIWIIFFEVTKCVQLKYALDGACLLNKCSLWKYFDALEGRTFDPLAVHIVPRLPRKSSGAQGTPEGPRGTPEDARA